MEYSIKICINKGMETSNSEKSRNLVKHLIGMGWHHIDNDFGGGTAENLMKLYDELFDAMDANYDADSEEGRWILDLARNKVYEELHRGFRISQGI